MPQPTVVVIGLGAMGSAAIASLARRGCRAIGIERYWPTHDRGSSHGESRAFRLAYYSDPAHVPFAQEARELWEQLARDSGSGLFTPCDAVIVAPEGSDHLKAGQTVAEQVGIPYEMLTASEVTNRWPTITPPESSLTFVDHSQAIINPEAAVSTNLQLAVQHGAELYFNTPVEDWSSTAQGVVVETPHGGFTADHLVVTPGPWATDILKTPAIPMRVGRYVQVWVRPATDLALFAADRHPRFTFEGPGGRVASGFPLLPGASLMKTAFIQGPDATTPTTPATLERTASPEEARKVIDFVAQLIPALRDQPAERSSGCMSLQTPDDNFVIGPHTEQDHVTIGAAFSVHGFKFLPVVGEILADLALDGRSNRNIDVFSPTRFPAAASA